jgi:hypothetical protein
MERREVVRYLSWLAVTAVAGACTPLRIVTRSFPTEFKTDPDLVAETLRAFTAAVVPGFEPGRSDPARALLDTRYKFAKYAPYFASDLTRRTEQRFPGRDFASLDIEQRTRVITDGLAADATTRKLYRGAIYLTQIALYAGIYDSRGCALIRFEGRYRGAKVSYTNPDSFLPAPATTRGNAA